MEVKFIFWSLRSSFVWSVLQYLIKLCYVSQAFSSVPITINKFDVKGMPKRDTNIWFQLVAVHGWLLNSQAREVSGDLEISQPASMFGCLCSLAQQKKADDLTDNRRFKSMLAIWWFESSALRGKRHRWNRWIWFCKLIDCFLMHPTQLKSNLGGWDTHWIRGWAWQDWASYQ